MPDTNMTDTNMTAAALAPYRVSAYNTAHESENNIHDDATARRFGFGGGLVPGVDVYGYITHMPVARCGPAGRRNLARGRYLARPRSLPDHPGVSRPAPRRSAREPAALRRGGADPSGDDPAGLQFRHQSQCRARALDSCVEPYPAPRRRR